MRGVVSFFTRLAVLLSVRKQVLMMTRLFSTLQDAGMPVLRSLKTLQNDLPRGRVRRAVAAVIEDVESGSTLSEAFAKHPNVFNRVYVGMIQAGEAGGALELLVARLVAYLEAPKTSATGISLRTLGTMISGGVPILQAISIVREMNSGRDHHLWELVFQSIRQGDTIASPMREAGFIPASVVALVDIGEGNGDLDTTLINAAMLYESGTLN